MKSTNKNSGKIKDVVLPDIQTSNEKNSFWAKNKLWILVIATLLCIVFGFLFIYSIANSGAKYTETLGQTISEVKKISEFCTANYIGEVMIQDEEKKFLKTKKIVLIVRGKIRAGFDLTKMETNVVNDTTINLILPQAQILDIITNPSDIRTFSEKGTWSHERATITKNSARAKLLELVMADNLLSTATENGIKQLTAIFSSFGFKQVNIQFMGNETEEDYTEIVGDSVSSNAITISTK